MDVRWPDIRALLGQHVRVKLADQVVVEGIFVGIGQGGDFEIIDDSDGLLHYCWPALSVEACDAR
jgi:biotin-(acetyl-CoA carboxylase) ligase